MYPIIVCFICTDQVFWPNVWVAAVIIVIAGFIAAYRQSGMTLSVVQAFTNLGTVHVCRFWHTSGFLWCHVLLGAWQRAICFILVLSFVIWYLQKGKFLSDSNKTLSSGETNANNISRGKTGWFHKFFSTIYMHVTLRSCM